MAERTLRELVASDLAIQTFCIQYLVLDVQWELKSSLFHLLPKFHAPVGKDPHKHLKELNIVCTTMRPTGVPKEHIKFEDTTNDWQYSLPLELITN